jgi:hypothetical protein
MSTADDIRKAAALGDGWRALAELAAPRQAALDHVLLQKAASADPALLAIAAALRPDRPLATYEDLGGTYSHRAAAE